MLETMLEKHFSEVYNKFKLQFYRRVFELVRERDGSLSAMEAFSLEVIYMLNEPTVSQFAPPTRSTTLLKKAIWCARTPWWTGGSII